MRPLLALLVLLWATTWALAQTVLPPVGTAALVCAYNSSPPTISNSTFAYVQCDTNGKLLTSGGGGSSYTFSTGLTNTSGTVTLGDANLTYSSGGLMNLTNAGSAAAPTLAIGNSTTGLYSVSTTGFGISVNGTLAFDWGIGSTGNGTVNGNMIANSFVPLGTTAHYDSNAVAPGNFVGTTNGSGFYLGSSSDVALTRISAGLFGVNGGIAMGGTSPTLTSGSCHGSAAIGGATAGSFTAPTCAASSIILSALPTAANGYNCDATDETTPADTLKQTAYSATSVTFTATTASGDNIVFKCLGF